MVRALTKCWGALTLEYQLACGKPVLLHVVLLKVTEPIDTVQLGLTVL